MNAPRLLFVPVSGPGGSGEYFRSLAIARGVERRWPDALIHFVVSRLASYADAVPYAATRIDTSPTQAIAAVVAELRAIRPEVVVFDSAGRAAQLKAAVAEGARCVYVSSRFKTRWKGFRLRRMRYLDEHWLMGPEFLGTGLNWLERAKLVVAGRPRVRFLPTCYEPPTEATLASVPARLGLKPREYLLYCPGGAGRFAGLAHGPTVFQAAAGEVLERTGLASVLVGRAETAPAAGLVTVPALPNDELMALVAQAKLCIINGGSLLAQCLAQRAPAVAAPIAGDQAANIACAARLGYLVGAPFESRGLARVVLAVLADESGLAALRGRVEALALRNGVDIAVEAIGSMLAAARGPRAQP
jgi:hypothetical protein